MKKVFTGVLGVAAMLLVANAALALDRYPPGPTGTCLDSVTIVQIQNVLATCHPATGDTVLGVGGIITGFDAIPTGFGFYLQSSQGGPYTGIDVFTHGTNYKPIMGLAVGDSVVVEISVTAEFQNGTEIFAPNNNFSGPNIVLRKVNSGNALPPFYVGTTNSLRELPTNPNGELYEGCLVQIPGPMTVARTVGLPFNTFLVVAASNPSDSVLVDGGTLTTYAPPATGSAINLVQGIYEQRTRGFRIQLRDGNDIVTLTPPGVSDAYPIADNQIRILFDRNVTTATATDENNYSLASFGSVDLAVMENQSTVVLTITNGLGHGISETVTISGITGLANGITMTAPTSRTFINGVLSVAEVSAPNPDSLAGTPCLDRSNFAGGGGQFTQGNFGPRLTMTGIVTGAYGNLFYLEDATPVNHGGITVFAPPAPMTVGRKYRIAGLVQEFFGETEFAAITDIADLGAAAVPAPIAVTVGVANRDTCDVNQNINDGEDTESMLVKLSLVKTVQRFSPPPTNGFHVAGQNPTYPDTIFIENLNTVLGTNSASNPNYPPLGTMLNVVGVGHYSGSSFRVAPRNAADITRLGFLGVPPTNPNVLSFSVYPNPARKANVNFTLPIDSDVQLGVFDVAGRQVVELAKGHLPAGSYSRLWSGRDANGKQVGAGVYFYRLKAGNDTRTVRAIMLGSN